MQEDNRQLGRIRNFVIISHIDHGKSTLADRLLEMTGTIDPRTMREQYLDAHPLERERGITIKMSPVRMRHQGYTLNLIDTPGHADFGYEVSRALAAVEGAVLLVDAAAGVQAQTVSHALQALDLGLTVIPVINKIDLPHADTDAVVQELREFLGVTDAPLLISAKTGQGVGDLLEAIVRRVPPPSGSGDGSFRALVFDSRYDSYRGVEAYVRVVDGNIRKGEALSFLATKRRGEALALFVLTPEPREVDALEAGTIGLIATGIKEPDAVTVGDTVMRSGVPVADLSGYRTPQPVVFASFFPPDQHQFEDLRSALQRLRLNDSALSVVPMSAPGLGRGFRCGFLGMLHLEIVQQRLARDEKVEAVVTPPSVAVRVRRRDGIIMEAASSLDLPPVSDVEEIEEPWVKAEIVVPNDRIGDAMRLLDSVRGEHGEASSLGRQKSLLRFLMPTAELLRGFYDRLKSMTAGFASLSYEEAGFRPADLVRLDVMVLGEDVPTLSTFIASSDVQREARKLAAVLKDAIPAQLIAIPIQVKSGVRRSKNGGWTTGDIVARETKRALRKDVTGYLYGGDVTRKRKLWEKQKRGKKRMQQQGGAAVPPEVYIELLKRQQRS